MRRITTSRAAVGTLAALSLIALTACGSGDDAGATDQIASLTTEPSGGDAATTATTVPLTADEAALQFSQCLRDEGLDVADIGVDADGNIDLRAAFENIDPQDETARAAMEACQDVLGDVGFGGGGRGPGADIDQTAIADAFLAFSDCIRQNGFPDVPDLSFQAPGGGRPGGPPPGADSGTDDGSAPDAGGSIPPGPQVGQRPDGFGDRNTIFAEGLGLDPDDPAVIEAMDACSSIIDDAFGAAGVGAPGQQPADDSSGG